MSPMNESSTWPTERMVAQEVTYTLLMNGKLFVIERVPARVNVETREQHYSPQTVERLHRLVQASPEPVRIIEAPVLDFGA